jgi:hypothetical protein
MNSFAQSIKRAIRNVIRLGDTDIFPYPIENIVMRDAEDRVYNMVGELDRCFDGELISNPPFSEENLVPVSYTGFRFGTQIEPLWNIYFLALLIELGPAIEADRIPLGDRRVFSYRFKIDPDAVEIFRSDYGWSDFIKRSEELAAQNDWIVMCDISDFYARLSHHPLENALKHLRDDRNYGRKIMRLLSSYTHNRSHGAPVGGPAARLLSELTLNQIDRLLRQGRVNFLRFADDYHIFVKAKRKAIAHLCFYLISFIGVRA